MKNQLTRDVDTVGTSQVRSSDGQVVQFSVGAFLDDDMELGSYEDTVRITSTEEMMNSLTVNKNEVMDRKVRGGDDTK